MQVRQLVFNTIILVAVLTAVALFHAPLVAPAVAQTHETVDQGKDWTPARREEFYALDQGSRIMPLRWIMALKLPSGSSFMADSLQRYGFLSSDAAIPAKLPVGFTIAGQAGNESFGMTCAACHTRQIEYGSKAYRIDGGPAIIDFQSFLSDLDASVDAILKDAASFSIFARAVFETAPSAADEAELRKAVDAWHVRNHALSKALPPTPWGPGRLDAIGMIFNRLTGLDLGPPPTYLIEDNIKFADAPVRYPFLWNAWKQNVTQWPGIAGNDTDELRLARNIGQVLGVFGEFRPEKNPSFPLGVDYSTHNSADLKGLLALERLTTDMGPPRWPWAVDKALAGKGGDIFKRDCAEACHGSSKDPVPWITKVTPADEVGTDIRELKLLERMASTGVLEGAVAVGGPLEKQDTALRILQISALGPVVGGPKPAKTRAVIEGEIENLGVKRAYTRSGVAGGYEARVLDGIWAAAPYLHNGSVPSLAELLKPAAARTPSFKIGPAYDPETVGLAVDQTKFGVMLVTTDCSDRSSGNSRCGHEYGTTLTDGEKRALLEFLKTL